MIERNVIFNGRGGGKTYTIMTEMHELIVAGRRSDILVIFSTMDMAYWFMQAWRDRFPHVEMPRYTSINAMDRVRGLRLSKVYVENIETIPDGIYNEKLNWLTPCFVGSVDPEITFTCHPTELGDKFFDDYEPPAYQPPPIKMRRNLLERLFRGKEKEG